VLTYVTEQARRQGYTTVIEVGVQHYNKEIANTELEPIKSTVEQ
jgi:hypothetical protein